MRRALACRRVGVWVWGRECGPGSGATTGGRPAPSRSGGRLVRRLRIDAALQQRQVVTDAYLTASYTLNKGGSALSANGYDGSVVPGANQMGAVLGLRHAF